MSTVFSSLSNSILLSNPNRSLIHLSQNDAVSAPSLFFFFFFFFFFFLDEAHGERAFEVIGGGGGGGGRVAEEAAGQEEAEKNSHSLQCIEAWLRSLGFFQSREDRAVWLIEKRDWHAHLSLDVTDLYVRYLETGPGNLDKDMERRFSYALSIEDIENAVLGGP